MWTVDLDAKGRVDLDMLDFIYGSNENAIERKRPFSIIGGVCPLRTSGRPHSVGTW
jgi:hypothetical protein